jgi:hypothetical protein
MSLGILARFGHIDARAQLVSAGFSPDEINDMMARQRAQQEKLQRVYDQQARGEPTS